MFELCSYNSKSKKKMGKKGTKSGGQSSAYNTIVLLDIEELWSHNVRGKAML